MKRYKSSRENVQQQQPATTTTIATTTITAPTHQKKGILKSTSQQDHHVPNNPSATTQHRMSSHGKVATFDENNIVQTLHPRDKDYGHMRIDEPKTPFVAAVASAAATTTSDGLVATAASDAANKSRPVDALELNEKLLQLQRDHEQLEQAASGSTEDFLAKRRRHYDEGSQLRKGRQLLQAEADNDDEETK